MGCRLASSQGLPVGLPTARCRDFSASRIRDIDGAGGVPSVVDCYGQHARSHFVNVTRCSFGSGCPASYPVFLSSVSSVSNAYGTGYQLHFVSGRHDPAVVFLPPTTSNVKNGFELTSKHHNSANGCRFGADLANNCAYIRKAVSGLNPMLSGLFGAINLGRPHICTSNGVSHVRERLAAQPDLRSLSKRRHLLHARTANDADSGLTRLAVLELSLLLPVLQHVEQDSY
jgi:hypothetical protein